MNPQIIKLYSAKKYDELNTLLINNFKINFFLCWFFFLPVFLELDFILKLWLIDVPEYTLLFCRIIMIRTLIKCFERPLITGMFAVGKMKYPNIISGVFLSSMVLTSYVLFVKGYSPYIPFLLDIVALIGCCIWDMWFLHKYMTYSITRFITNVMAPISIIILISLPVTYIVFLWFPESLIRLISVILTSMFISAFLIYFIGIGRDMRNIINKKTTMFYNTLVSKIQ
jgi:O-antigen/teichoic acid export membrane protein